MFDSVDYEPFNFNFDWNDLLEKHEAQASLLHRKGVFIASQEQLSQYKNSASSLDYILVEDWILESKNFSLGKFKSVENLNLYLNLFSMKTSFLQDLLQREVDWLLRFEKTVFLHLKNRISEGVSILKNDAVKILFAEFSGLIFEINTLVKLQEISQSLVGEKILLAANILAKLAGGRAFLQDSIIEMRWFFSLLDQIYLRGEFS